MSRQSLPGLGESQAVRYSMIRYPLIASLVQLDCGLDCAMILTTKFSGKFPFENIDIPKSIKSNAIDFFFFVKKLVSRHHYRRRR